MKILFSSYHNPRFETITEYIEQAITGLGHELIIFDDRQHIIPGRIRNKINFLNKLDLRNINKNLLSTVDSTKPDVVIVAGGHRIQPETVEMLYKKGVVSFLWTIDAPLNFRPIIEAAPFYKYIFCQGTEAVGLLAEAGITNVRWLPVGYSPNYHQNIQISSTENKKFGFDVVFMGSYYPVRKKLFEELTQFNIGIWGPGWEKIAAHSPLKKAIRGGMLRPKEWTKLYSASKIVLAPHYQDPEGKIPVYQASPRIFEALACKAFVLSDRQKDVLALFKDKEQLVYFDDKNDIKAKIKYYLNHPEEREKIAAKGYECVTEKHTFTERVQEMLSFMNHYAQSGVEK